MVGTRRIAYASTISAAVMGKPGATVKDKAAARAADMAGELGGTFLSMLLKEMRQTLEPDGGLFPGDSGDVQGGLFDLYLGRHMADGRGIGLAATLVRQMQESGTAPKPVNPNDAHHAL